MKYMILIYHEPNTPEFASEDEARASMGAWFEFTQRIVESGEMVSGEPLQGIDTATTVSVRNGTTIVTDGPFAETKEVLGGYYLVDVESRARAEELAAQLPSATYGRNEVRPLMEMPEMTN